MNASELIYSNKIGKRVLLFSQNYRIREELESILSQIQMPNIIKVSSKQNNLKNMLEDYDPHLILIDNTHMYWEETLAAIRIWNTEVPIILLVDDPKKINETQLILAGVQRFIQQDTLRFCGQILYKSIHGYSLQKYYNVETQTQQNLNSSIQGLKGIQDFWKSSESHKDTSLNDVLSEVDTTLNYLSKLQKKLKESDRLI